MVNCAYMDTVLFKIADPALQCLHFRLLKSCLRVVVGHKTSRRGILAQTLYSSVQARNGSATRVCSSFETASCNCPCSAVSACNPRKVIRRDAPSSALKPAPVLREVGYHPVVRMVWAEDWKMGTCSRCRLVLERIRKVSFGDRPCLDKDTK